MNRIRFGIESAAPDRVCGSYRTLPLTENDIEFRNDSWGHDALAVEEHVCGDQFTADEIVHHETGHIAMALSGVVLRPAVVGIDGVGSPAPANRIFELSKRVHEASTVTTPVCQLPLGANCPVGSGIRRRPGYAARSRGDDLPAEKCPGW